MHPLHYLTHHIGCQSKSQQKPKGGADQIGGASAPRKYRDSHQPNQQIGGHTEEGPPGAKQKACQKHKEPLKGKIHGVRPHRYDNLNKGPHRCQRRKQPAYRQVPCDSMPLHHCTASCAASLSHSLHSFCLIKICLPDKSHHAQLKYLPFFPQLRLPTEGPSAGPWETISAKKRPVPPCTPYIRRRPPAGRNGLSGPHIPPGTGF